VGGWDYNGVIKETHYTVMGYNGRMWESQQSNDTGTPLIIPIDDPK